jgi:hypothetical protein
MTVSRLSWVSHHLLLVFATSLLLDSIRAVRLMVLAIAVKTFLSYNQRQ